MALFASQEERNLTWSEFPARLKALTFILIGLVVVMAIGLALGVDVDNTRSIVVLVRALFGQEEVISEGWLWVARISVAGIVGVVLMIRQEQRRIVRERREGIEATPDIR